MARKGRKDQKPKNASAERAATAAPEPTCEILPPAPFVPPPQAENFCRCVPELSRLDKADEAERARIRTLKEEEANPSRRRGRGGGRAGTPSPDPFAELSRSADDNKAFDSAVKRVTESPLPSSRRPRNRRQAAMQRGSAQQRAAKQQAGEIAAMRAEYDASVRGFLSGGDLYAKGEGRIGWLDFVERFRGTKEAGGGEEEEEEAEEEEEERQKEKESSG